MAWIDRFTIFIGILYGAMFYRLPLRTRLHVVRVGFRECFTGRRWL